MCRLSRPEQGRGLKPDSTFPAQGTESKRGSVRCDATATSTGPRALLPGDASMCEPDLVRGGQGRTPSEQCQDALVCGLLLGALAVLVLWAIVSFLRGAT